MNNNLLRNKAILWARDVITRTAECCIVTGDSTGKTAVFTIEGLDLQGQPSGRELIVAGVQDNKTGLPGASAPKTHDVLEYYRLYVNSADARLAEGVSAVELNVWVRDLLQKMAASSLVLDQADTGAGRWTAAHFKPNASVMEKLKSAFKNQ